MINLVDKIVELKDSKGNITSFEVWWVTPFGMFDKLDEAIVRLKEIDLDPNLILKPIVVAICDNGLYEPVI